MEIRQNKQLISKSVNYPNLRQFALMPKIHFCGTTTCALYCIYMAHLIYLGLWSTYSVPEDDILQFAQEHFGHKFVKHAINL